MTTGAAEATTWSTGSHWCSAPVSPNWSPITASRSKVNPLSEESTPSRDILVGVFRDAVAGAKKKSLPAEFEDGLPSALMIAHLLLALFWVYDRSPGQRHTQRLVDGGLRLLRLSLPLLRIRVLRAPLRELLDLVAEVRA